VYDRGMETFILYTNDKAILTHLVRAGSARATDLCRELKININTTYKRVNRLREAGLVEYSQNPQAKPGVYFQLSGKGLWEIERLTR
jgi:DNA-binding MarR family transcriptional regulator